MIKHIWLRWYTPGTIIYPFVGLHFNAIRILIFILLYTNHASFASVCKDIVNMHKGRISVHSEGEGRGCIVVVELPVFKDNTHTMRPLLSHQLTPDGLLSLGKTQTLTLSEQPLSSRAHLARVADVTATKIQLMMENDFSSVSISEDVYVPEQYKTAAEMGASIAAEHEYEDVQPRWPVDDEKFHCNPPDLSMSRINLDEKGSKTWQRAGDEVSSVSIPEELYGDPYHQMESRRRSFFGREHASERTRDSRRDFTDDNRLDMKPVSEARYRVLLVDDAKLNRKMMARMLALHGECREIEEACDGLEAVTAYMKNKEENKHFDLVVLDYEMPNLNGPDAAAELRHLGYTGLIVGMTGVSMPKYIEHFLNQGANEVLEKPLDVEKWDSILEILYDMRCLYPWRT